MEEIYRRDLMHEKALRGKNPDISMAQRKTMEIHNPQIFTHSDHADSWFFDDGNTRDDENQRKLARFLIFLANEHIIKYTWYINDKLRSMDVFENKIFWEEILTDPILKKQFFKQIYFMNKVCLDKVLRMYNLEKENVLSNMNTIKKKYKIPGETIKQKMRYLDGISNKIADDIVLWQDTIEENALCPLCKENRGFSTVSIIGHEKLRFNYCIDHKLVSFSRNQYLLLFEGFNPEEKEIDDEEWRELIKSTVRSRYG